MPAEMASYQRAAHAQVAIHPADASTSSTSASDDLLGQLRKQIAMQTSEKEATKVEMETLKRMVESNVLRLNGLLTSGEPPRDRLRSAVLSFDADLRGRLDTDASDLREGVPSEGTYEVLRTSLSDSQRRCQILNGDMLRVADANDELMSTLRALKTTNKRLVEEVQKQTEELSLLTSQRLLQQENISRLDDAFRHEQQLWQQAAQRCVDEETQKKDEEFRAMEGKFKTQLHHHWREAKGLLTVAATHKQMQSQLRGEVVNCASVTQMQYKKFERELQDQVTTKSKHYGAEKSKLKDKEHNLTVKLNAEREVREHEVDTWRSRYTVLCAEKDDLGARYEREISQMQAKLSTLQATHDVELDTGRKDRAHLQEQLSGLSKDVALFEAMTQTARTRGLSLEAAVAQKEGERARLTDTSDSLVQQIRESDEALGEAVRSNEALREQMEVQRLDSHAANERDLKLCRDMYEKRLEVAGQNYSVEMSELHQRIHQLEESLGLTAGDIQVTRDQLSETTKDRDQLQREHSNWKSQHELAESLRSEVDKEFNKFRQDSAGTEMRRLQEIHDESSSKKAHLDAQKTMLENDLNEAKRHAKSRDQQNQERLASLTDFQGESAEDLRKTRTSLAEAERSVASAKADSSLKAQQLSEKRSHLDQELSRIHAELEAESKDLIRRHQAEKLNAAGLRDSFEKLKEDSETSHRLAVDRPQQQIKVIENGIGDVKSRSETELTSMRSKAERTQLKIQELEVELSKAQAKLGQMEQEIKETTNGLELTKRANSSARDALEREKEVKSEELRNANQRVQQKSDQIKSATRAGEEVRKRMIREIEVAKSDISKTVSTTELKTQALKSEFTAALEEKERLQQTADKSIREKVEGMSRENEHLRQLVAQTSSDSSSIPTVMPATFSPPSRTRFSPTR